MKRARLQIEEKEYWKIIDKSLVKSKIDVTKQMRLIKNELSEKSLKELIGFCYHNSELYRKAYTSHMWAAVYTAMKGCGDSSFHYFRCWLVTRGSQVYYDALNNPDSLVSEFEKFEFEDEIQFEFMHDIANEIYKGDPEGRLVEDIIEEEYEWDFESKSEMEMSEIEFDWSGKEIESLKKICPKIFDRYWYSPLKSRYYDKI